MPYRILTSDVLTRFTETNILLNTIRANEKKVIPPAIEPTEHKILKGLFYISLYSCIEFTFTELCTKTLSSIKSKNIIYSHFDNKFLTIALSSTIQAARDCNPKKFLDKASDIFYQSESFDIADFNEMFVSPYLQNIWGKSFNQLTKTLGITTFIITQRESATFDEIVENRNIVAHGRNLAQVIGSSPNYNDLKNKYDIIFEVLNRYIKHFETYYKNKEYVKTSHRTLY